MAKDQRNVEERMARFLKMTPTQAVHSFNAHKGKRTEYVRQVVLRLADLALLTTPASVRILKERVEKYQQKCEDIELCVEHLCVIQPDREDVWLKELKSISTEQAQLDTELCEAYNKAPAAQKNILEPLKASPADSKDTQKVRVRNDIKPEQLCNDNTPVEFKLWAKAWRVFFIGSNLQVADLEEQQQALVHLLDKPLASKLRNKIDDGTPIFPDPQAEDMDIRHKGGSVLEVLEKIFRESNPVFKRRCELLNMKPSKGEPFSAYMSRLIESSEECDLTTLSHEDFILLIATMHCNKDDLRRDIKRMRKPTWIEVERMVEDYERSMLGEESHKANQVQRQGKPNQGQGKPRENRIPKEMQGKCFRCAKDGHRTNECKLPASVKCGSCSKEGHITKACLSAARENKTSSAKNQTQKAKKVKDTEPADSDSDNDDAEKANKVIVVNRTTRRGDSPDIMI